jgi:hypothetical protein
MQMRLDNSELPWKTSHASLRLKRPYLPCLIVDIELESESEGGLISELESEFATMVLSVTSRKMPCISTCPNMIRTQQDPFQNSEV